MNSYDIISESLNQASETTRIYISMFICSYLTLKFFGQRFSAKINRARHYINSISKNLRELNNKLIILKREGKDTSSVELKIKKQTLLLELCLFCYSTHIHYKNKLKNAQKEDRQIIKLQYKKELDDAYNRYTMRYEKLKSIR